MIKILSSFITLIQILVMTHCATPEVSNPQKVTYLNPDNPSEVIDLNQVKMVPMLDPDGKVIKITQNEDGKPVALLSLEYSSSGLDVIDAIQRGEVLEHSIVIRDEKGEEIGRAPINILQYEVEELSSNRGEKKILFTNSGSEINIKKTNELPPIQRRGKVRVFKSNEVIPQYIELKYLPKEGSYISAYLELIYVKPYLDVICKDSSSSESALSKESKTCPPNFHLDVNQDFQSVIQEKEEILSQAVSNMNSNSIPKEYREKLVFAPKRTTNEYRMSIKNRVNDKNPKKFETSEDIFANHAEPYPNGTRYYYREWRLVSSPQFFMTTTKDTPVQTHKRVETDYTYFESNEQSQEAEIENVVIEVESLKNEKVPTEQTSREDLPSDSKKISLEEAKKQEIGIGSNCKIYLKTGKYFSAKLISLEGYQSIQVEVNGQIIEVPKKDIEVIYFPKASTWQ